MQLAEVLPDPLLPDEVLPLAVVLLFELPPHPAARSATAAIAQSAVSRRKIEVIRKSLLLYRYAAG